MTEKRVCERERDIIGDRLWYELYCFVFVYQNKNKSLLFPTKNKKTPLCNLVNLCFFFWVKFEYLGLSSFFFFFNSQKKFKMTENVLIVI